MCMLLIAACIAIELYEIPNNKSGSGMIEQIIREIKQEREEDIIIIRIEEETAGLTFHLPFYPCRTTPPIRRYRPAPIT